METSLGCHAKAGKKKSSSHYDKLLGRIRIRKKKENITRYLIHGHKGESADEVHRLNSLDVEDQHRLFFLL